MKKISFIILLGLIISFSCSEDYLDLEDPSRFTLDSYYTKKVHAIQATNACYSTLQKDGTWGRHAIHFYDITGDEFFCNRFCGWCRLSWLNDKSYFQRRNGRD